MFSFNRGRINWNQPIGEGFYGIVYPYQKHPEDKKWVVKMVKTQDHKNVLMCLQEIKCASRCNSQYILPITGHHIEHNPDIGEWEIFMRMPRMKTSLNLVLEDHIERNKYIPEDMIAQYFYAIAKGLQHMHERSLAHRDIKPENVLISEDGHIIVTDLGLSDLYEGDPSATVEILGDPVYAAPENQEGRELKKKDLFKADLWSLGVSMVELCTQLDVRKLNMGSSKEGFEEGIRQLEVLEGEKYSRNMIDMIISLLQYQPEERKCLKVILHELETRPLESLRKECKSLEREKTFVNTLI